MKIDVVSDVVLLLLLDETGSGVMICPGTGAVAPRSGRVRNEEVVLYTEEDKEALDRVLACLRGGGFTERSG